MKEEYPTAKADLFAGFIERCVDFTRHGGAVAMITMQSWMFLSSYEKLRASLLCNQRITSMLHLGTRAFDSIGGEVVSSTAFILVNESPKARNASDEKQGTFIRLVDGTSEAEKVDMLHGALAQRTQEKGFYFASGSDFKAIPGTPIVYWLSEKMRASFSVGIPLNRITNLCQGMATANNSRFLRQWWEVSRARTALSCTSREEAKDSGARWFPYNKGGEFRKWYGNQEHVVNWENDGRELHEFRPRSVIRNPGTYFSPSVSWSKVSSGESAFRFYPSGFIYDVAGTSIFSVSDYSLEGILAFVNSHVAREQLAAIAPTLNYEVGQVAALPVLETLRDASWANVSRAVQIAQLDWAQIETSWEFTGNPLVSIIH